MNDEVTNGDDVVEEVTPIVLTDDSQLSDAISLAVELQEKLEVVMARVVELEAAPVVAAAPAGDDELRALAITVRTAQRAGHPDAQTHLDALLNMLGAV